MASEGRTEGNPSAPSNPLYPGVLDKDMGSVLDVPASGSNPSFSLPTLASEEGYRIGLE